MAVVLSFGTATVAWMGAETGLKAAAAAEAESSWLRVSTPYSGDGKGQLFTPEKGSQVLVGYEHGQADLPVVLGNLFHAQNPQKAKYSTEANHLKGLQTAGGNKVVMSDKKGEQTILLSNANNKGTAVEVGFKGDGSITIKSNGPVTVLSPDITLEAGAKGSIKLHAKTITLAAEDDVKIGSKNKGISLKAQQDVVLKAEKDVVADATGKVQLKGAKGAGLTSPQTVDLGTGQTVNISATTVNQS